MTFHRHGLTFFSYDKRKAVSAFVLAATVLAGPADVKAADETGETLGFLVTQFAVAIHYGDFDSDCPDGLTPTTDEAYLLTQSPAERARLLLPENAREFEQKWKTDFTTGPNGEDICRNPRSFLDDPRHPLHKLVQSKVSYGMNLDGDSTGEASAFTCKHENFTGVNGEDGVDNQMYRIMGCAKSWRGDGPKFGGSMAVKYNSYMKDGLHNFLIELKGVNDRRNDPDVEVGIYSTENNQMLSASGDHIPNQSFTVTKNPRWHNIVHGAIVDGVLTTDMLEELNLDWFSALNGPFGAANEYAFRRARLRVELLADGTLKGILGGYLPIETTSAQARNGGKGVATNGNRDCASEYKSMAVYADGYPDPVTGQCTHISMANDVVAIPAFVIHGDDEPTKTASAKQ
ncbi:MAG: hypothetical protein KDE14_00115 [Rhodobacteraceae bacterium]|nr:hypothetical protein [Paracoccaceae bacterium]